MSWENLEYRATENLADEVDRHNLLVQDRTYGRDHLTGEQATEIRVSANLLTGYAKALYDLQLISMKLYDQIKREAFKPAWEARKRVSRK